MKKVSVIMPVYNEARYIKRCIDSLLQQDYPQENMEWIFVDGMSSDNTKEIIRQYQMKYTDLIRVFDNEKKIVPCAMNIGIKNAEGKYIIRLDAHADYAEDYISKCVHYLDTMDADNVGGLAETKSSGFVGNTIAMMLSSKFGVGNSQFRTNGKSGYVDTVPFGAFRKEVFDKWGGYDERLVRNQDIELNYRIRKNGGKVYLSSDIHLSYYCRDTLRGVSKLALTDGKWNIITMNLCPGSMGIRHFVPLCFVLSLIMLPLIAIFVCKYIWILFMIEILLYLLCDIIFSAVAAKGIKPFMLLLVLFPVFHISYGVGSLKGIVCVVKNSLIRGKKDDII